MFSLTNDMQAAWTKTEVKKTYNFLQQEVSYLGHITSED